ncbi:Alpha-L-fucosidase [Planctomycetes bacterium CA13]|uniref:alpha-L-fucosidase n=1 Tax=Novipirellula herctigrandis TaxID=2527986 RepID=A0A5C5YVR0_9BACT|nr:Alpha-L-fucosidase [Planctomycetes bacterium CA13]
MRLAILLTCVLFLSLCTCQAQTYQPDWSSLRKHDTPEWLDGMKFGIYCHWGPQTVLNQYPDKDLSTLEAFELWKGEKFSSKEWVDLFQAAGAQFAGPVSWHGSGILNWDSGITDWTTVKRGPKIDIVGELTRELQRRDMKVLMSFHNNRSIWGTVSNNDSLYLDPLDEESKLYTANEGRRSERLLDGWLARVSEAIDNYHPDLIWVDTSFGGTVGAELQGRSLAGRMLPGKDITIGTLSESHQQQAIAHFFNMGIEQSKEVEFIYKSFDVPPGIGMRDIENGSLIGLQYDPWMADINMAQHYAWPAPWFHNPKNPMKNANHLVDLLVDMTSKNGRMLLSVPPLEDGTFTADQKKQLYAIGGWLKINGEAIYDTVPWTFFGEGPTEETHPGHHAHGKWDVKDKYIPKFTKDDIRFTQNGKNLYAIVLDWPGDELIIRTLGHAGKLYRGDIKSVSLLGCKDAIQWEHTVDALVIKLPKEKPCDFAYAVKIERK